MKKLALALVAAPMLTTGAAHAAVPIYPAAGTPNAAVYNFTASTTGSITAYFAGASAGLSSVLGLLVNGVDTGVTGLDNKTTVPGTALDFGSVNAGDALTFYILVDGATKLFSDASLNPDGLNHAWATAYAGGDFGIPAGTFMGFEDRTRGRSDFDYNDLQFVITNIGAVPEIGTWAMMIAGLGAVGFAMRRRRNVHVSFA